MPKIKSIKKLDGKYYQKCIKIDNPDGLFVLENGLITHNSSDFIMRLYWDGRNRVWSRMKGNKYSFTILDSSPNSRDNAIDDYILNDARTDPTNMIVEGSMWKWSPEEYDFSETFKIYTGGKGNPPKILTLDDPLLEGDTADKLNIIEVPLRMADGSDNKRPFEDDLIKSLKDRAGIPSGSATALLYDYSKLENMFKPSLKNIYYGIKAPAEENPVGLIWNQVKDLFFKNKAGKYEFYYKPQVPRVIAVDQSYATDVTGICCAHMERYKDTGDNIFVIDFTIPLIPTKDSKINLDAIRCFIEDLVYQGNLRIEAVGFDSFESQTIIQNLTRKGFNVQKVSTDKSMDPYLNLINYINSGKIVVGRNIFLKNNIKSLHTRRLKSGKLKIDHDNSRTGIVTGDLDWDNSIIGSYAKDVSDSVADAVELCRKEFLVAEETWWGEPIQQEKQASANFEAAKNKLDNFLKNFSLTC